MLTKNKVREAIRITERVDNPDYFGWDQAYVTYPAVFPTVLVPIEATDELNRLASETRGKSVEHDEEYYDFFIGLNGFLPLKTDTCIEFLDYDGMSYVIDIDDNALPEIRKVLDEQLAMLGQSVDKLLDIAEKVMKTYAQSKRIVA